MCAKGLLLIPRAANFYHRIPFSRRLFSNFGVSTTAQPAGRTLAWRGFPADGRRTGGDPDDRALSAWPDDDAARARRADCAQPRRTGRAAAGAADGRRARGGPPHAAILKEGASPVLRSFRRTGDGGIPRDLARHRRESAGHKRVGSSRRAELTRVPLFQMCSGSIVGRRTRSPCSALGAERRHFTGHTRQRKAETSANSRRAVPWSMSIVPISRWAISSAPSLCSFVRSRSIASIWRGLEVRIAE